MPFGVERLPRLRHRHDQRHTPASERASDEVHGVDGLESLRAARGGNKTDGLVREIGRLMLGQQDQPVQRVLERAAHRAVVGRTAPYHRIAVMYLVSELPRGLGYRVLR